MRVAPGEDRVGLLGLSRGVVAEPGRGEACLLGCHSEWGRDYGRTGEASLGCHSEGAGPHAGGARPVTPRGRDHNGRGEASWAIVLGAGSTSHFPLFPSLKVQNPIFLSLSSIILVVTHFQVVKPQIHIIIIKPHIQ